MGEAAMTGALRIVDDADLRYQPDRPAVSPKPTADVGIFHVHEKAFVKAADGAKHLAAEHDEHTGEPIDQHRMRLQTVIRIAAPQNRTGKKAREGRRAAGTILCLTMAVDNQRASCAGSFVECRNQIACRVAVQPDVGIDDTEIG